MAKEQCELDFGLPAGPWRPRLPERLFFALLLAPTDQARFADCQAGCCAQCGIGGNRLVPTRFHVSLQHVRDDRILRSRFVYAAQLAARKIRLPPFDVRFRSVGSFRGRPATRTRPAKHPFVLHAENGPVVELGQQIGREMRVCGLRSVDEFVPHMTFGYDEKLVRPEPVNEIGFVATDFALVHSKKGLGIYNVLDRWRLDAG